MSMKRSKQRSSGRATGPDDDSSPWTKPADPEPNWSEVEEKPDSAFVPFSMTGRFAKGQLISHPKFGKGLVLAVETNRIEVLFKDGKKKLGHAVT